MHQYLIREQASLDTLSCFLALELLLHMQLLISLESLVDACNLMLNQFSFLTSSPMSKSSTPGLAKVLLNNIFSMDQKKVASVKCRIFWKAAYLGDLSLDFPQISITY